MTNEKEKHGVRQDGDQPGKARRGGASTRHLALTAPRGPGTHRGAKRSRTNAAKHGIFTVGLVRKRESKAEYQRLLEDLLETIQPVGRLEEILAEKLAMLVWRYRRLLQAEAAEVESEAESAEEGSLEGKSRAAFVGIEGLGLISRALCTNNEVILQAAIQSLTELRELIQQQGLDWERDRNTLKLLYGTEKEEKERLPLRGEEATGEKDEPDPGGPLASKYRELAVRGVDQQGTTGLPADPAQLIVRLLDEKIETFESMLGRWLIRTGERNELGATAALVPSQEVADRFQRYEGNLERAFERTLAQLERLQRLRLGQPAPPGLRVDVSH